MAETQLSTSPPEKYLADFENKRNEFLIIGRLASVKLFQEGHLQDANRICDAGLEPNDIDTQDLKGQVQHFMDHPDLLELSKMRDLDTGTSTNSLPSRRLLRSVSDRRPRRRAQLWSFESDVTDVGSNGPETPISTTGVNDSEVFAGETPNEDKKPKRGRNGLHRSNSESTKSMNVMQKIKCFEQQAGTVRTSKPSGKMSLPVSLSEKAKTIKGEAVSPTRDSISFVNQSPTHLSPPKPKSPAKSPDNEAIKNDQVHIASSTGISIPSFRNQVAWTELGASVNEDLRKALEKEFFSSRLLTSGCFATFDGDLLAVSRGCRVTKKEIQSIVGGMMKREYITSSKIVLGGTLYSCLSATGHVFRARTGILGINCTTFKKTLLISFYAHPVLPKPIGKLVQELEKYLSEFGY